MTRDEFLENLIKNKVVHFENGNTVQMTKYDYIISFSGNTTYLAQTSVNFLIMCNMLGVE